MKILMVSSSFPKPSGQGKPQTRTFSFLKYLHQYHEITLVTQADERLPEETIVALKQEVGDCIILPATAERTTEQGLIEKAKQLGVFFQQGIPPRVIAQYSPAIQWWLDQAIASGNFDLLTCEGSKNEIYVRPQWREQLPTVINIQRSVYGTYKQQLENQSAESGLRNQLNLPLLRRYEKHYCSKFSRVVVATPKDQKLLKSLQVEAPITPVANGLDLNAFPKRVINQEGRHIIFIGAMNKPANIDAAVFLSLEILPKVRQRYPGTTLELVGNNPVEQVRQLGEIQGIKVIVPEDSAAEYLHKATVCVIPLRKNVSTKMRTLQALATGTPLVASDYGLEGLAVDGTGVPLRAMRANTIDEYVYAIGRLFQEPKLREKLCVNGRILVENEYTWEQMGERYEQVLLQTHLKFAR